MTAFSQVEKAICCMLQEVFSIGCPHRCQLDGISYLSVKKGTHEGDGDPAIISLPKALLVVQKTSLGKSLIVLGTAMLRKKVSLCVVPLIAIAADQTQKARTNCKSEKMVAYHLDEIRGKQFREMKDILDELNSDSLNNLSVILYCSPQSIQAGGPWHEVIFGPNGLASKQLISLLAFDEADCIPSDGRFFRREFASLKEDVVAKLRSRQETMPPIVAMTATLTQDSRMELEKMLGVTFTKTLWGPMDRRHINLTIQILGQPTSKLSGLLLPYVSSDGDNSKFMIYTHDQTRADGDLLEKVNAILRDNEIEGCARAFTGTTGMMEKCFLVRLFAGDGTHPLCNLHGIVATKSAIRGVSSHDLRLLVVEGMLMNMDDFVQLQGRVGRGGGARTTGPPDCVHVLLSLSHFRKLSDSVCDTYAVDKAYGRLQLDKLLAMLRFLVLPSQCYHMTTEAMYEHPDNPSSLGPCSDHCPFCRGDHLLFTGTILKAEAVKMLKTAFHRGPSTVDEFYKAMNTTENKDFVWIAPKSTVKAGQVQALVLQFIASGIVEFDLRSSKVHLAFSSQRGTYMYEIESSWADLHTIVI